MNKSITNGTENRCCYGDYCVLNSIAKVDRYPIPNINSFTINFSKIDLMTAYQIKLHPKDI